MRVGACVKSIIIEAFFVNHQTGDVRSPLILSLCYDPPFIRPIIETVFTMTIEKVVIIIPTYNEASVIAETLTAVFDATGMIPNVDMHVLVFDSASTDGTAALVTQMQAMNDHLHLKAESAKSGLGSAYLQAMQYALTELSADIVFEFDADLSHQPEYIAPMLEQLKTHDVVVGSRYVKGGRIPADWGWHRKLLSVLGNYVARALLTPTYKDFTSGFRATRREALQRALPKAFLSNHYAYKLQLLWLLHQHRFKITEYPIVFVDRQKGFSKLPANSIMDSLHVILTLRFYEFKRYIKMCVVGLSGMTVQFLLYNACRHYFSPFHAAQIAVTAAIINNFILNSRFTFKHRQPASRMHQIKSLGVFLSYSVSIIYLQSYWLDFGVKYLGSGPLRENLIVVTGMIMGSFLNYFIYSRVVWREKAALSLD